MRPLSSLTACTPSKRIRIRLKRVHGRRISKVKVFVDRRRVLTRGGRSLRVLTLPGLAGRGRHTIRVYEYNRKGFAKRITRHVNGCG
jgi:hypothetical protein